MNRPNTALRSNPPPASDAAAAEPVLDSQVSTLGARLHHARLVMCDGARYGALTDEGACWASVAAGCLLRPEVGDLVLLSVAAGQGYVLTVLERGTPESIAHIEIPGSLRLSVPEGRLEVTAAQGVALDAGASLSVTAHEATAAFARAEIHSRSLRVEGEELRTDWNTRTDISGSRLDIATRSETHAAQSVRRIAGHEDVSAGSTRLSVAEDWSVHAATADLKARDRVAVDAGSVQIG